MSDVAANHETAVRDHGAGLDTDAAVRLRAIESDVRAEVDRLMCLDVDERLRPSTVIAFLRKLVRA